MLSKPDTCKGCPLHTLGRGFSTTSGTMRHGVLLVGEALGEDEMLVGRPFVGKSGEVLNRIISRVVDPVSNTALTRDDFLVANTVWCQPPGNVLSGASYEDRAISHCSPYLDNVIKEHKPKAILAMGNQALRRLTGEWGIDGLRGYVFETKYGPVIGSYHPSFIVRGKWPLARVFQMDLRKALYVARHGVPRADKQYILHPSPMDAERWAGEYEAALKADPALVLAADIETAYKSLKKDETVEATIEDDDSYIIRRISFSFKPFTAITFPWIPPYISVAKRILASRGDKTFWNGDNFDVPRLEANDVGVAGKVYDAMQCWHFLEPALPMGLKYAATFYCPEMGAWKLEAGSRPELYSAADSDVLLRCFNGIRAQLVEEGRWDTFERHFVQLAQLLRRMSLRGVRVDQAKRVAAREAFERRRDDLVSELALVVPEQARPIEKIYKQDEATLKKGGKWEEGRMKLLPIEISQEEHEKMVAKAQKKFERLLKAGQKKSRKKKSTPPPMPVPAEEKASLS